MRYIIALLFCMACSVLPIAAADEFPYKAIIKSENAQVRSGPGKNFYATDKLDEGTVIEVHRHDPGGWCAIRPPDGSFSWVRARYLDVDEESEGGLGVINAEEVVSRIGSALSDARDVIQVHLEKGESVELVDGDEAKPGQWRKIAPPAGEFRWIPLDAIERAKPDPAPVATADHLEPLDEEAEDYVRVAFDDAGGPTLGAGGPPAAESEEPQGPVFVPKMSHAALQKEIVEIDLEMSKMAAEHENTWNFHELRARAEKAVAAAPTALDRAQVRDLLNKIARFEQLKDRTVETQLAQQTLSKRGGIASRVDMPNNTIVDTTRYDGVGRLTQVISKQSDAPKFALVDPNGTVQYYINPSPGINLRQYLNREVGVNGTRGQVTSKQRQLINVQRVTELPGATKRF